MLRVCRDFSKSTAASETPPRHSKRGWRGHWGQRPCGQHRGRGWGCGLSLPLPTAVTVWPPWGIKGTSNSTRPKPSPSSSPSPAPPAQLVTPRRCSGPDGWHPPTSSRALWPSNKSGPVPRPTRLATRPAVTSAHDRRLKSHPSHSRDLKFQPELAPDSCPRLLPPVLSVPATGARTPASDLHMPFTLPGEPSLAMSPTPRDAS